MPRSGGNPAAVQPHQHGAAPSVGDARRPDEEAEAVLALRAVVPLEDEGLVVVEATGALVLRCNRTISTRAAHARPGRHGLWRTETVGAAGDRPVGNTLEGEYVVLDISGDATRS